MTIGEVKCPHPGCNTVLSPAQETWDGVRNIPQNCPNCGNPVRGSNEPDSLPSLPSLIRPSMNPDDDFFNSDD
jgi:hypothetical protein